MEEIRNDEIEQVAGGTAQEERDLRDFIERFMREIGRRSPMPIDRPVYG